MDLKDIERVKKKIKRIFKTFTDDEIIIALGLPVGFWRETLETIRVERTFVYEERS